MSLDEFVAELALVREENPREPDAPPEDSSNAVKIMTVHSAKGLEFPVVFVAAIHKGVDTDVPVVAFSRHHGLGARWRNPATGKDKDDLYQHALRQEWKRREEEESSRLLYVAMTRAENHLVLSFSGHRPQARQLGQTRRRAPGDRHGDPARRVGGLPLSRRPAVESARPHRAGSAGTARASAPARSSKPRPYSKSPFPWWTTQHDSNATVTALSLFASCPRKYYLSRYLGFVASPRKPEDAALISDEPADLSASEFGTQVHALLAGKPVPDPAPEALRLAEVFRQSPLGRRAARAARSAREFDFLMALEDLVIRGQVDLWFEEGGELVVADYKTDDVNAAEAHHRARDYALQLRLYALAVEHVAGRAPDRAFLHFLRPNTLVEIDLTPNLIESPEQTVRDFQQAQSKLDFPLNEGGHCKRCPFYHDLCPAR